jgi:hypothetical protein
VAGRAVFAPGEKRLRRGVHHDVGPQGARAIPEFEPSRIHAQLYAPEKRGVPGEAMERFLREAGFRVFVLRGEWADLEEHLSKGRPLLVCLGPSGETRLHYALAAGVDTAQGAVWLNDPARRKLTRQLDAAGGSCR